MFVAVAAVIVYRIIMTIDYCTQTSPIGCLILTSVFSAVLNAAAILILGKVSHSFTYSTAQNSSLNLTFAGVARG